ncbi:MAG: hypothetical protein D6753_15940 [Planctomycetota bacterium]|nr:MAG: hypothetical protein D6753_15940 [Planctomycetota bacterium]
MASSDHQQPGPVTAGEPETAGSESDATVRAASLQQWWMAIAIAGAISWALYSFPAYTWRVPDRLSDVSAMSPQAEQDELAAVELANLWKNTLFRFTFAGLGWGTIGFCLLGRRATKHWTTALGPLIVGIICGALAGVVGLQVRQYFNLGHPIPLISDENRPLVADSLVMAVTSAILLLPVSFVIGFQSATRRVGAVWAPPLAGVLTGFVAPLVIGIAFAAENTSIFPPQSLTITIVWYALTVTFAGILVTRSTPPAQSQNSASESSPQESSGESA